MEKTYVDFYLVDDTSGFVLASCPYGTDTLSNSMDSADPFQIGRNNGKGSLWGTLLFLNSTGQNS